MTVIIPVLDPPREELERAMRSLIGQTAGDWAAFVVDDGSDVDLKWIDDVDERVRLVKRGHEGVSAARNAGVTVATTRWIAFLDHDDIWAPTKLSRQIDSLERSGAALSHTAFEWEQLRPRGDGSLDVSSMPRRYPGPVTYLDLLRGDHICTSSVVMSRDAFHAVGGFDVSMSHAEDLDLWLRLLQSHAVFDVVDEPLVTYRTHDRGASSDYQDTYLRRRELLRRHLRSGRRAHDPEVIAAARAGLRRGREIAGAQAFDVARATRGTRITVHLTRALWRNPRLIASSLRHRLRGPRD
ncbi:glycosyltransferase family 2 protein [Luteimicrobium sp. DT211]|uniref:glycosyltransferase family 2 protein n=1 Tax=Luteimicrobium sp. DT211 TaxID=3393412 RepID=UPI003CF1F989